MSNQRTFHFNEGCHVTFSDIHAKLKMWGSIERPMSLNKFGELLKRGGYSQRKLHSGKRGYVVQLHENLIDSRYKDITEIISAAGAAGCS